MGRRERKTGFGALNAPKETKISTNSKLEDTIDLSDLDELIYSPVLFTKKKPKEQTQEVNEAEQSPPAKPEVEVILEQPMQAEVQQAPMDVPVLTHPKDEAEQPQNEAVPQESEQTAERDRALEKSEMIAYIRSFFIKLGVVILAGVIMFGFIFGLGVVNGEDMYPRMRDGDLIFYYRLDKSYVADEVTTYQVDGMRYVGRVVAVSGDTVDISEDGGLIINGAIQQEQIFYSTFQNESAISFPCTVGENEVFVLGDFRTGATDSRTFGPLSKKDLDGKVIALLRRRGI